MPALLPDRNREAEARADSLEAQMADIQRDLESHRRRAEKNAPGEAGVVRALEARAEELREALLDVPVAWQSVALARHPQRPKAQDFIQAQFGEVGEQRLDEVLGFGPYH